MTTRERKMAMGLGILGAVIVFGGGGFYFMSAYASGRTALEEETKRYTDVQDKINAIVKEKPQLDRWRRLSLQTDASLARSEYNQYLRDLMTRTGLLDQSITADKNEFKSPIIHPTKPGKLPIFTGLTFDVDARASMSTLIIFLKEFQRTPKMHRLKKLSIERSETLEKAAKNPKGKGSFGNTTDPPDLIVKMTIEALIILDAESLQKRVKTPDRKTLALEFLSGRMGLPIGLPIAGWSISREGPIATPVNQPLLAVRNYESMIDKNIFKGPQRWTPADKENKTPDDLVNMMKFNRFIQMSTDGGVKEARLWDFSEKMGTTTVQAKDGFRVIPLIQDKYRQKLLVGKVVTVDFGEVVFRVGLNAHEPKFTKWWRYPADENSYRLHAEDLAALVAAKKVKEEDKNNIYLVSADHWAELERQERVHVSKDYRNFQFAGSYVWGDILTRDSQVVVVRMTYWPLPSPRLPSVGISRMYPDPGRVYNIDTKHLQHLIAIKKKVKESESDRIYVFNANYFNYLRDDKLVTLNDTSCTFYHELVRGDVVHRDDEVVVIRLPEKYCRYQGFKLVVDEKVVADIKPRWHEGFCSLKIGQKVEQAILEPLSEDRVHQILHPPVISNEPSPRRQGSSYRLRRVDSFIRSEGN